MKFAAGIFCIFTLFSSSSSEDGVLPSYIKPCSVKNNFEKCVREQISISLPHFTKGVPELGVPSLDPVNLDDIKIDGNGLKLTFSDAKMYGVANSTVTDLKINMDDEKFTLAFKSNMSLTAKYVIDGQILILPIKGKGDAVVKAKNVEVVIRSKLIHVNDSKGEHFKLTTPSYSYDMESTKFNFQNLFNGNKQLSDATHQFANENWRQIMDDVAPSAIKQIVRTCVKAINKFFSKVTIPQIVLDYDEYLQKQKE